MSLEGFNKIGFIKTEGLIPAASACITCALPISRPSSVIYEFKAIFCDLNGATLYPSCANTLHNPPARILFPAFDIVPCIIIGFAIFLPLLLKLLVIDYFLLFFLLLFDNTLFLIRYNSDSHGSKYFF